MLERNGRAPGMKCPECHDTDLDTLYYQVDPDDEAVTPLPIRTSEPCEIILLDKAGMKRRVTWNGASHIDLFRN